MANQRLQSMRNTRAGSLLLLACLVLGGWGSTLWAGQAPAKPTTPKPAPAPAKKALAARPTRTAKRAATSSQKGTISTSRAKRARRAAKPARASQQVPMPKKKEQKAPVAGAGRRDPFKLPVVTAELGGPGAGEATGPLPPGSRGLIISQLQLEGIVRLDTSNTMIAVVTNPRKLAYFLRENDPVYNGAVSKITPDAVYFKENHLDPNGQVTTLEVVKRLNPAPGERK